MQEDSLIAGLEDQLDVVLRQDGLTVDQHSDALQRDDLTRVLITEVIDVGLGNAACQTAADALLQLGAADLHLLGQVKEIQDILIRLDTDGTKERRHGELLLAIDIGVHHIVGIGGKLDPRALEGNDTSRVKWRTIGMDARAEEYPGRAVELRDDDALRTIYDEGPSIRHVGDVAQEDILNRRVKVLVVGIRTGELELCLEGHTIGQPTAKAFLNGVLRRIDIVVEEFEDEVIARIGNREVLVEDAVESFALTRLGSCVQLEEVAEGLQLDLEEVWELQGVLDRGEVDSP